MKSNIEYATEKKKKFWAISGDITITEKTQTKELKYMTEGPDI